MDGVSSQPTVEKLLRLSFLRPQDLPLAPDLILAEGGVLIFVACELRLVRLIATAGSWEPHVFVVVGAVEIGTAFLIRDGLRLSRGLCGDGLAKSPGHTGTDG